MPGNNDKNLQETYAYTNIAGKLNFAANSTSRSTRQRNLPCNWNNSRAAHWLACGFGIDEFESRVQLKRIEKIGPQAVYKCSVCNLFPMPNSKLKVIKCYGYVIRLTISHYEHRRTDKLNRIFIYMVNSTEHSSQKT